MPRSKPHRRAADPARLNSASLSLQVTLLAREEDAELRALIERYEQLLCDWEGLSVRALKVLAGRQIFSDGRRDAVRRT